ncbi:CIT1 [Symbiodinium natans]|uniref:CIT1 protein n=1 Tax=Symbiodinium natans TaxID=878477 RepID=A0A812RMK2_9DINO|nr:CIT1 [Symbiodinium natans]
MAVFECPQPEQMLAPWPAFGGNHNPAGGAGSTDLSATCNGYVQGLEATRDSRDASFAMQPEVPEEPLSVGSLGHPIACRRPCVYMTKNAECQNGRACGFCHCQHPREVKLDRDQRAMLHKLPYGDFLEIISEVLEAKAAEAARPIVWEAVRMLEEEAKLAGISVQGHDLNAKALKRLKKRLAHLNVVSLLALANRRCQGSMSTELVQIAAELRFQAE